MKTLILVPLLPCFLLLHQPLLSQDSEVTPKELFKSFKQTDKGNCTAVAYIKAAISVFGIDSLFKKIKIDSQYTTVIMRDSSQEITVTQSEIQQAVTYAKLKLSDTTNFRFKEIENFAHLCYALMGKKRQRIENIKTFENSLKALDNGSKVSEAYKYLGLKKENIIDGRWLSRSKGYTGLIVYNWKHAAFASYGKMDLWGKTKNIKKIVYYGRLRIVK
jgi:hypothetical protein